MEVQPTMRVRWNGGRDDPDEITQHGTTFRKGEWTTLKNEKGNEAHAHRARKLMGNPTFEVKGHDQEFPEPEAPQPVAPGPVRAPDTKYSVRGDKKKGFYVVDDKGIAVEPDKKPFATAEDAQNVADALNAPKP